MLEVIAASLEEAYIDASSKMGCSITELEIDIIQNPSKGFLGIGKKQAIIHVLSNPSTTKEVKLDATTNEVAVKKEKIPKKKKNTFSSNFHRQDMDMEVVLSEIQTKVNHLFKESCFNMDSIHVELNEPNEVFFKFNGEDAALLIGKEGYRYKALSYYLYNWVHMKYGLNMRLEIAEFLKNQEENITLYLADIKEKVVQNGRAQTKILDGVLIKIALEELRATYPNKYVAIKTGREGGKFIVVNDFIEKH